MKTGPHSSQPCLFLRVESLLLEQAEEINLLVLLLLLLLLFSLLLSLMLSLLLLFLLAPTGALVLMMVYYISAAATHFFRFSISPLMQLMLQVSL